MTHDIRWGLGFSVLAAATFGFSGTLASPLIAAGWSPAAVVLGRVLVGSALLLVPTVRALRGRWHLLRTEAPLVVAYGAVAVAFTQFAYFSAVAHIDVAVALLVEYVAPVAVLGWLWLRHAQRPSATTAVGAAVSIAGLVFVLDLFSGAEVSAVGIAWSLAAMGGCAVYFLLSARPSELPGVALAGCGLVVGVVVLALAGAVGLLELHTGASTVSFRSVEVPWVVPMVLVGLISTALAYGFGIAGLRLLGSRLASFVALLEVVAAVAVAWALLGQAPSLVQVLGGLGILTGVVLVKLGEPAPLPVVEPVPETVPVPQA